MVEFEIHITDFKVSADKKGWISFWCKNNSSGTVPRYQASYEWLVYKDGVKLTINKMGQPGDFKPGDVVTAKDKYAGSYSFEPGTYVVKVRWTWTIKGITVSDTKTYTIEIEPLEGKAVITKLHEIPTKFTPDKLFYVTIHLRNDGGDDTVFVDVINKDTGEQVRNTFTYYLKAGVTASIKLGVVLSQKTNFRGQFEAGHLTNGGKSVDDTASFLIPVYIPPPPPDEGKAVITKLHEIPTEFTPDKLFYVTIYLRNDGGDDTVFVDVINKDTGEQVRNTHTYYLKAGITVSIKLGVVLPQKTDFRGQFNVGHLVNGSKAVDDNRDFSIPVVIPPKECEDYFIESDCIDAGCYWYEGACHKMPPDTVCSDYTTESTCTDAGCYWYDDACHSEPVVVPPEFELPIVPIILAAVGSIAIAFGIFYIKR